MRRRFLRRTGWQLGRLRATSIPRLLIHSNQLFAAGNFAQAAHGLEELARAAEARGGRRAARLYLEAGRARIMAAQPADGIEPVQRGLQLLAAAGRSHRLSRSGGRIIAEFVELGFPKEARQITGFMKSIAPDPRSEFKTPDPVRRPSLPTHRP